mmetsp:Transcript_6283/g.10404  ORF Transcript_6283/g.10404 Transcript_6283/m.10404 type:complete len:220 (-) Transcript_6283:497-1156(-)
MLQSFLTLLILDIPQTPFLSKSLGCFRTPMKGGPMHSIPSLHIGNGRISTQSNDLSHGAAIALDTTESTQDHERRPSIFLRLGVAIFLGNRCHQRTQISLGTIVPRIQHEFFQRRRTTFVLASSSTSNRRSHHDRITTLIHDFIVMGEFVGRLFLKESIVVLQTLSETKGLDESIVGQIDGSHNGLNGETNDHATVKVQSRRHGDAKQGAAEQRSSLTE